MRPVTARGPVQRAIQSPVKPPHTRSVISAVLLLLLAAWGSPVAAIELAEMAAGFGGFVINGIDVGDRAGISVSAAGDVNGDGLDDVIVGAFQASPTTSQEGAAYVVFGKTDTDPVDLADVESGTGGFVISGFNAEDWVGFNVSGAGDVNGDLLDDVIVGSFFGNASYVVFGKVTTDPVSVEDIIGGIGGFAIGDFHGAAFGAVSGAGDVNGDGRDDMIVGAGFFGDAHIIFGKAGTAPVFLADTYLGFGGIAILASGAVGGAVSGAGDINGDGLDDVIAGYSGEAVGDQLEAGRSYIVFGKDTDTLPIDLALISDAIVDDPPLGFVVNGISAFDESGTSVSGAGDVNGDLLDDVIIGAPFASPFGFQAGESYIVFGKADTAPVNLFDVTGGVGGIQLRGFADFDNSGTSVAGAGDVDGDFLDDMIIGAPGADANFLSRVGISYVVFGTTSTAPINLSQVEVGVGGAPLLGINQDDQSGLSVSGAGDINGDGLFDLIVGADSADPMGLSQAGQAYVVFGGLLEPVIWVDFAHVGTETGSFTFPFNTLAEALEVVLPGRAISIKGDTTDNDSDEILTIDQPVIIQAVGGPVFVGLQSP